MDLRKYTVTQIRKMVKDENNPGPDFMRSLASDGRVGVKRLYLQIMRHRKELEAEERRLENLYKYESQLYGRGIKYIAGVDEAGRGPLAGPVVAAAVILPAHLKIYGLDDSKKLSPAKRSELAKQIKERALGWGLGVGTVADIEVHNIHHASLLAMKRALEALNTAPEYVLADGFAIPGINTRQTAIKKGDSLSASIASASIIAKETRDSMMREYDKEFPHYGFSKHKGYPTSEHIKALKKWGPSPLHRRGYKPIRDLFN